MKNILTIFTLTLVLATMPLFAQNIRQAKQAKVKQQQSEASEKARINKAKLSLQQLTDFADIVDVSKIDRAISALGYKLDNTSNGKLTWAFEKNKWSNRARYWAYWYKDDNNDDVIFSWLISDEDYYKALLNAIKSRGYVKTDQNIKSSGNGGLTETYKNKTYIIKIDKDLNRTYEGDAAYTFTISNYIKAKKLEEQRERETQQWLTKVENSYLDVSDVLNIAKANSKQEISKILTAKGWANGLWVSRETAGREDEEWLWNFFCDSLLQTDNAELLQTDNSLVRGNFDTPGYVWDYDLCLGSRILVFYHDANDICIMVKTFSKMNEIKKDLLSLGFVKEVSETTRNNSVEDDTCPTIIEKYTNGEYTLLITTTEHDEYCSNLGGAIDCYFESCAIIFNSIKSNARRDEVMRIAREKAIKEKNYNETVAVAEHYLSAKNYGDAKAAYLVAMSIKPELESSLKQKITDIDVIAAVDKADSLMQANNLTEARECYNNVLKMQSEIKKNYAIEKINEIDSIQTLLEDVATKTYDYNILQLSDYQLKKTVLARELKEFMIKSDYTFTDTRIEFSYTLDLKGKQKTNVTSLPERKKLNKALEKMSDKIPITLKKSEYYGYNVKTNATYIHNVSTTHIEIPVRKDKDGFSSKNEYWGTYARDIENSLGWSAPYANYSFYLNRVEIDGKNYKNDKLVSADVIGGPSCAFLSMLLPGLGDHKVTYGEKNGLGVLSSTALFAGAGAGLLYYNNNTPKDVLQGEPYSQYYTTTAYACFGIAGAIWLYDIIYVAVRGAKNAKAVRNYAKTHLVSYYDAETGTRNIAYSIRF